MLPRRFPTELEELLSPKGRRVLAGKGAPVRGRFAALQGLIAPRWERAAPALLERALADVLAPMEDPIPPEALEGMTENYGELLPKTVRVQTALFASRRAKAWQRAEEIGLHRMLRSQSFHALAEALGGLALRRSWGTQVLCYRPGDYAGPHNDHHPEEPEARGGYLDLHLTFCSPGVAHQWLVYERGGHFSQMVPVGRSGTVTCYRLPFWHYTTPLQARRGKEATARRWVLLGTFLFKRRA